MDGDHLEDLTALEWARFRETRLVPLDDASVATHLAACAACREKVAGFERIERMMHPYGAPASEGPRSRRFKRLLLAAVTITVLLLCSWLIL